MMERDRSSMRPELPDARRWRTRFELANAIFDYIEALYHRQRRRSGIDYVSATELELSPSSRIV